MEHPIQKQFEDLSLSSPSFCLANEEPVEKLFQITISSRYIDSMEKVVPAIITEAMAMHLRVWGPRVLPIEVMNITTRLAPTREGINGLVRNSELRFYRIAIDVFSSTEVVEQITSGFGVYEVYIEVKVVDLGGRIP